MSNVSDLAIVGIIATLGVLFVAASFDRRRRRHKPFCQSSNLPIADCSEVDCSRADYSGVDFPKSDFSRGCSDVNIETRTDILVAPEKEPLFFYNILYAYSTVALSPSTLRSSQKEAKSEPLYSTWAKHAAKGEDEIIIEGPIPYLISHNSTASSGPMPLSVFPQDDYYQVLQKSIPSGDRQRNALQEHPCLHIEAPGR